MYLSKLRIENYRSIRNAAFSCEDGITVLVGENGCGKSSVLNAIEACLGRKLRGEQFDIKYSDFFNDLVLHTQSDHLEIELFFEQSERREWLNDSPSTKKDGSSQDSEAGTGAQGSVFGAVSSSEASSDAYGARDAADDAADEAGDAEGVAEAADSDVAYVDCADDAEAADEEKAGCSDGDSRDGGTYQGPLRHEALKNSGRIEFRLLLSCDRNSDNTVSCDYFFLNSQGEEILEPDKKILLLEVRRLCPFMRIRSSVLTTPVFDDRVLPADATEEQKSRYQVEMILKQAYSDLLREADYMAEQSLRQENKQLDFFYEELDRLFRNSNPDVKERLSAPLSPLNSWLHYVSLLRGSGARSIAMLYFAGAFFNARGSEVIGPDSKPIISIEYPEANLHPLMLASLWNLINRIPTQMLVTTYCVELLSAIPFRSLRRLVRSYDGVMQAFQVPVERVNMDDMRRIAYHLRVRRGTALFMRVWLLVEGETEYWLLPEIARAMGFDLWQEGVEFIEFAQCGLEPLVRLANYLGISWFLLCDGDKAGQKYAEKAERFAKSSDGLGHVVRLSSVDIEHSFWDNGYAEVFIEASGIAKETVAQSPQHQLAINAKKKSMAKVRAKALEKSREVIKRAVKRVSKPGLALLLGKAAVESGMGIPSDIENLIFNAVSTARQTGDSDGGLLENCKPDLSKFSCSQGDAEEEEHLDDFIVIDSQPFSDTPIDTWGFDPEKNAENSDCKGVEFNDPMQIVSDEAGVYEESYEESKDRVLSPEDEAGDAADTADTADADEADEAEIAQYEADDAPSEALGDS